MMTALVGTAIAALAATAAVTGAASADDDFPLIGTYMQNAVCKGDASDNPALKVKISAKEIVSNIGVCNILGTKHEGGSYMAHVECRFPAGPLVGDITFTPLPDKTVKFVDRDNTYNAILHRCPD